MRSAPRLLGASVLASACLLGLPTAASAASTCPPGGLQGAVAYPPDPCIAGVLPPQPGQRTVVVSGRGFAPGTPVTVQLEGRPGDLGSAPANRAGVTSVRVTLPAGLSPGQYVLLLSGQDARGGTRELRGVLILAAADPATRAPNADQGGGLPRTGVDTAELAGRAVLVTAVGAGLVVAGRRRRT